MQIIQKGNKYTNYSSRDGYFPAAIVNHISAGSMSSMDNWFTSPDNRVSSAHYGIAKTGRIHQYVDMRNMAWANGITASATTTAPAKIVRDHPGTNPNKYTVSIEHEGTDGDLTEAQFAASVWLHRYIQQQVKEIWSTELVLDPYHVIGHYQIDPVRKATCPGEKFPWSRLYLALKGEDEMSMAEKALLNKLQKTVEDQAMRIKALESKAKMEVVPTWAEAACKAAKEIGMIDTTNGSSNDFYRIVTVLHRGGFFEMNNSRSTI